MGWLAWEGRLSVLLPANAPKAPAPVIQPQAPAPGPALGSVETRLALLEDRLSRIDLQAQAASGNAARAEAMLVAFAARRLIDRGEPLGYVENQLRLRFGDAQPNAVETIVTAARQPVTLDELAAQLDSAASSLTRAPSDEGAWQHLQRELSGLFVIRTETTPSPAPRNRVARARLLLLSGKVDAAIAEVRRLPGARGAQGWIEQAQRYDAAHRALDLIETTAMLEPRRLQDSQGRKVEQASPIAPAQDVP